MAHDDSKNMVTPLTQHTAWMDGIAEQVAKCVPASPDAGRIAELEKRVAALEEAVRPKSIEHMSVQLDGHEIYKAVIKRLAREQLCEEWDGILDETKEMARQLIKSFSEKGLTICDAREVLRACEIYIDANGRVAVAH